MTPPHYPGHGRTFLRQTFVLRYGCADASVHRLATDFGVHFLIKPWCRCQELFASEDYRA
jgi:hypothetical protein